MDQAVGHFRGITLMAENGHFERPATREEDTIEQSDNEWKSTTPDIDLSWMDPVEDSCHYFEQRTPGSSVIRNSTSVTFSYHNAQRQVGSS